MKYLGNITNNQDFTNKTYVDSKLPTSESLTISTSGWSLNSTTSYYEYSVTKSGVTASTQVNIYLDIDNQKKFTGTAYTLSSSGGYKIITDKLPTENISATVVYQVIG